MTGSGTEENPYIIYDVDDLDDVRNDLNAYYELGNDIDASDTNSWNYSTEDIAVQYIPSWNIYSSASGIRWRAQVFTLDYDIYCTGAALEIWRIGGTDPGDCTICIQDLDGNDYPTGNNQCSATFPGSGLSTGHNWYKVNFTETFISAGQYAVIFKAPYAVSSVRVDSYKTPHGYIGGDPLYTNDGGVTWGVSTVDGDYINRLFKIYHSLYKGFDPIGSDFTGSFDGKNYAIDGLFINRDQDDIGLFENTSNVAVIKNVYMTNLSYNIFGIGNDNMGGLVGGYNEGLVENCHVDGIFNIINDANYVAGIVGYAYGGTGGNNGLIIGCSSAGTINILDSMYVGGMFGQGYMCNVLSCSNSMTINSSNSVDMCQYIGGIGGGIFGGNGDESWSIVSGCYNTGDILANPNLEDYTDFVGGIVGQVYHSKILECYNTGEVQGVNFLGGIVGWADGDLTESETSIIYKCYSTGNVTSFSTGSYVGYHIGGAFGEIGGFYGNIEIHDCYARGSVTASGGGTIGGFCGNVYRDEYNSSIQRCYSTGQLITVDASEVGGFAGYLRTGAVITDCYWDKETSGLDTSDGGIGKTTAEMKQQSTFTNWNFSSIWSIYSPCNDGYPCLQGVTPNCTSFPGLAVSLDVKDNEIQVTLGGNFYRSADFGITWYGASGEPSSCIAVGFNCEQETQSMIVSVDKVYYNDFDGNTFQFVEGDTLDNLDVGQVIETTTDLPLALVGSSTYLYKTVDWKTLIEVKAFDDGVTAISIGPDSEVWNALNVTIYPSSDVGYVKVGGVDILNYPFVDLFATGEEVTLEAYPTSGYYTFGYWTGDVNVNTSYYTYILVLEDENVIAVFDEIWGTGTIKISGGLCTGQQRCLCKLGSRFFCVYDGGNIKSAYSDDFGRSWTEEAQDVSSSGGDKPACAINSDGDILFVWREGLYIKKRTRYNDGSWGSIYTVDSGNSYDVPSVVFDHNDSWHIIWEEWIVQDLLTYPHIFHECYASGKTELGSTLNEESPSIAVDMNGRVRAVWRHDDTGNIYYGVRYDNGTWGRSTIGNTGNNPVIAYDSNNVRYIAYDRGGNIYCKRDSSSEETVYDGTEIQSDPSIAIDKDDNVTITWKGKILTSEIDVNFRTRNTYGYWGSVRSLGYNNSYNDNLGSIFWASYPKINGMRTNVPQGDSVAVVYKNGNDVSFYGES